MNNLITVLISGVHGQKKFPVLNCPENPINLTLQTTITLLLPSCHLATFMRSARNYQVAKWQHFYIGGGEWELEITWNLRSTIYAIRYIQCTHQKLNLQ